MSQETSQEDTECLRQALKTLAENLSDAFADFAEEIGEETREAALPLRFYVSKEPTNHDIEGHEAFEALEWQEAESIISLSDRDGDLLITALMNDRNLLVMNPLFVFGYTDNHAVKIATPDGSLWYGRALFIKSPEAPVHIIGEDFTKSEYTLAITQPLQYFQAEQHD